MKKQIVKWIVIIVIACLIMYYGVHIEINVNGLQDHFK